MLYILSTIAFVMEWTFQHHAFIEYGDNYHSVYTALWEDSLWWRAYYFTDSITGGVSTIVVDITIVC